jgi:hypothetical protein
VNFAKYLAIAFCAASVIGCAEAPPKKEFARPDDYVPIGQVQIASRFETVDVTLDNLGSEAHKCVPQLDADSTNIKKERQHFPSKNILIFGHVSSANSFVVRKTIAVCIHESSEGFPIFAAEAFLETANPKGVPPDVIDSWNKQIALLIAAKGEAKIAYAMGNGNAFTVSYWVESSQKFGLSYSSVFKKTGDWENEKYDAQFSYPTMAGFSVVQRSGSSQKIYLLSHRFN